MKRRMFTSKAKKAFFALLVNIRRFISLPDLFSLAPTNRPWVSEDARRSDSAATKSAVEIVIGCCKVVVA